MQPACPLARAAAVALFLAPMAVQGLSAADPPGLGPRGDLVGIEFEPGVERIVGKGGRRRLLVSGRFSSGQVHDLTDAVAFSVDPPHLADVAPGGELLPRGDGAVRVTARAPEGATATVTLALERCAVELPVNFADEVVPVFTRLGCNAGGCHGKSDGQNGFRLSLLGFYPEDDYDFLVHESRGRRVFPADPAFSLLLRKPTNRLPHGGGRRMEPGSYEYEIVSRWIGQGMPAGDPDAPVLERIEVVPAWREMQFGGAQRLAVVARSSDGTARDVTALATFESNQPEIAQAGKDGRVTAARAPGEAAVMVRFQGQVAVFRAVVPQGLPVTDTPPERGVVDRAVMGRLRRLGIPPAGLCDDATFLRRATVDITARLPTVAETEAFLADASPDKRDRLVDRLLDSPAFADAFASKWGALLRNKRRGPADIPYTHRFHAWIRDAFAANMPFDRFVRGILTATGDVETHPPAAWFREVATTDKQMEDTAQLFLGMRLGCAKCHHHPFERWSQQDYAGFEAFFTQVGLKSSLSNPQPAQPDAVFLKDVVPAATNPRSTKPVPPTPLGGAPLDVPAWEDARQRLVDWMVSPDNPYFARALVNRTWKHFLGRGIVEPEDDLRVTNPPVNPELLDALAARFVESGFDFRDLVRTICTSSTYQLSSETSEGNRLDRQNFSTFQPRRLPAEVLYDAINHTLDVPATFNGLPRGTTAVQLPDNGFNNYFLTVFGKPEASSACECERNPEANLAQSLHLLNSQDVQSRLQDGAGMAAALARDGDREAGATCESLYLRALSRRPTSAERQAVMDHVSGADDARQAWEDVLWALVNTKEFQFVW